jgi:hypothetical protein
VDFHPLRMCVCNLHVISSMRTTCSLIICGQSVIYFLFMYVWNKILICLYTILAIIFYVKISVICFLPRKKNLVFKWWGITRKSLASLFKEMKTYVQCNIQWQKLHPWSEINKHILVFTYQLFRIVLDVYNDVHQSSNNSAYVAK